MEGELLPTFEEAKHENGLAGGGFAPEMQRAHIDMIRQANVPTLAPQQVMPSPSVELVIRITDDLCCRILVLFYLTTALPSVRCILLRGSQNSALAPRALCFKGQLHKEDLSRVRTWATEAAILTMSSLGWALELYAGFNV